MSKASRRLPNSPFPIPHSPFFKSTRFWVIALAMLFVFCALAALLIWRMPGARTVARISVDGEVVRTVDLSAVTGEMTFVIETAAGANTIAVRPGGIRVVDADCPDGVCVKQGWLEGGAVPIVCLPHRLVISLIAGGSEDALDATAG